jgi:hypothetical protein
MISWITPTQQEALLGPVNKSNASHTGGTAATSAQVMTALQAVFNANPGLCAALIADAFNNKGISRSGSLVAGSPGPTGPLDYFAADFETSFLATTFSGT